MIVRVQERIPSGVAPIVPALLFVSAALLALAPLAITSTYSWVEHTTSESAAQGVDGAWVARAGFVAFGLAVAALVVRQRRRWNVAAAVSHGVFAGSMFVVAAFSARSWVVDAPFDRTEDLLHSIGATAMGFAFVAGVILRAVGAARLRLLDVVAVAAATVLPIGMAAVEGAAGALQRLMFVVAYGWYLVEAVGDAGDVRRTFRTLDPSAARPHS